LIEDGFNVTIDHMGENTHSRRAAMAATSEFLELIGALEEHRVPSSVSLDLSHIGLSVDRSVCLDNAFAIADRAALAGCEVMISMEESDKTDQILEIHGRLAGKHEHVGITIQTRPNRSRSDLAVLMERPGRVRLVKGAYAEPPDRASFDPSVVDTRYRELATELVTSGHPCSVATHDAGLIASMMSVLQRVNGKSSTAEIEMLDGVQVDVAEAVLRAGLPVRKYIVYGREWFLYLMHRLAEHPPAVFDALKDFVEGLPPESQTALLT